jgi:hypothetical protein
VGPVHRSGSTVYLTPEKGRITYASGRLAAFDHAIDPTLLPNVLDADDRIPL